MNSIFDIDPDNLEITLNEKTGEFSILGIVKPGSPLFKQFKIAIEFQENYLKENSNDSSDTTFNNFLNEQFKIVNNYNWVTDQIDHANFYDFNELSSEESREKILRTLISKKELEKTSISDKLIYFAVMDMAFFNTTIENALVRSSILNNCDIDIERVDSDFSKYRILLRDSSNSFYLIFIK